MNLKARPGAVLGKHRNTGTVVGHTLQGKWHYKETDWTASAGHFTYETPGAEHTIEVLKDNTEDTILLLNVWGSLEFVHASSKGTAVLDFISAARLQHAACKKLNMECPFLAREHSAKQIQASTEL
eukprot:CAMPEP_0170628138 /NCGR_PEP_ID=MMETSP0224-20130122/32470_1 /TAXON_ID=285029 /ORGANISM="Togula jolla, Strain CCCM 725" /LENGTH=125 /DNA_ID=CAMNT_0010955435 /DNA_START=232 /DNA_END=609 /DNA_ORIENTATION=+